MSLIRPERYPDLVAQPFIAGPGILSLGPGKYLSLLVIPVHPLISGDHPLLHAKGVQPSGRLAHIRPPVQSIANPCQKTCPETQARRQMRIVKRPKEREQFAEHTGHTSRRREQYPAVYDPGQIHSVSASSDLFYENLPDIHIYLFFLRPLMGSIRLEAIHRNSRDTPINRAVERIIHQFPDATSLIGPLVVVARIS